MGRFFCATGLFLAGIYVVAMPLAFLGLWIELRLKGSHNSIFADPGVSLGIGFGLIIGLIANLCLAIWLTKPKPATERSKGARDDLE